MNNIRNYFLLLQISFLLYSFNSAASGRYSISEVRRLYHQAVENPDAAQELRNLVSSPSITDPLLLAYRGGAEALMAKHAWNPYSKLEYLSRSMHILQQAIDLSPQQAEIRFIRFSVQYYIPRFLGFSKNLDEDAHVIAKHAAQLKNQFDRHTYLGVCDFMISSGSCTADEIQSLKQSML